MRPPPRAPFPGPAAPSRRPAIGARAPAATAALALLLAAPGPVAGAEAEAEVPTNLGVPRPAYAAGEFLSYSLSWAGVPAGNSTMSVVAGKGQDGDPVLWLVSLTRSNRAVSHVYPIQDRVVSELDPETRLPRRTDIAQHHGRRERVRTILYDQAKQTATTQWKGRDPVTMKTPPRVQDVLSVLYHFRSLDGLEPGRTVAIDLNDGKHNTRLRVHVEQREEVLVPAGRFDTLRVWAEIRFEGVFLDEGDARLWITDDARHVPVQVSVKVPVGRVTAELSDMALPPLPSDGGTADPP
jgi:hypothetical protein